MQDGFVLILEYKDNKNIYPYVTYYNPIEINITINYDIEYYSLHIGVNRLTINSFEEYYNFNDIIIPQIDNLKEKQLLYYTNEDGFSVYDCDNKNKQLIPEDSQSDIKNQLFEIMAEKILCQ